MTNFCPLAHQENERNILIATEDWARNGVGHGIEVRDEVCPTACNGPVRVPLRLLGVEVPFLTAGYACPNPQSQPTGPGEFEIV